MGCIRFRKVDAAYFPFLICIILAAINEMVTMCLSLSSISSTLFFQTYSFLESILLFLQFMLWRNLKPSGYSTSIGIACITTAYIGCMMIIKTAAAESVFMILYSVFLIILSLREINYQLVITTTALKYNANLLISVALLVFYTYAVLIEVFWWYGLDGKQGLSAKIYDIMPVINFIVNLIFTYAILWIPRKPKFILQ